MASAYAQHRSECYTVIAQYEAVRSAQFDQEIGHADIRLSKLREVFDAGRRSLSAMSRCIERNARLEASLINVHHETRALLLENNSLGYAVVYGRSAGRSLGPLGELLLATRQLDWRLGERAITYSELCAGHLVSLIDEATNEYVTTAEKYLEAAASARRELRRRTDGLREKLKAHAARKPSGGAAKVKNGGGDMWLAEKNLRVSSRGVAQQQREYVARLAECDAEVASLETWRATQLHGFAEQFVAANATFRDDLVRVGERLVRCGRSRDFARFDEVDRSTGVKSRIEKAHAALPSSAESREEFVARQDALDATATSRGALVFPAYERVGRVDATRETAPLQLTQPAMPAMPFTHLVAKKGVLDLEKTFIGQGGGWSSVFAVVTFEGHLHAFNGRTEGAVETEDAPCFTVELGAATVEEEEEGPVITIKVRRSLSILGERSIRLRCKDAAEKYSWFNALRDPLKLFEPTATLEAASSGEEAVAPTEEASSSTPEKPPAPLPAAAPAALAPAAPAHVAPEEEDPAP